MRRKSKTAAKPDTGPASAHPLLTDILLVIVAALLRGGVARLLERGNFVQSEDDRKRLQSSPARRLALAGAKRLATRSVPGALLVGAGILGKALIRSRRG